MSESVLDHRQVMDILPHRAPMLLIDDVTLLRPMERIEARSWIDPDWDIFRGHFPGSPVFPGVLSVECMAQAADIMIMSDEKYAGRTPLFASIERARFVKGIFPGDTVTARATVVEVDEKKAKIICETALCRENGELAATATLTIAIR